MRAINSPGIISIPHSKFKSNTHVEGPLDSQSSLHSSTTTIKHGLYVDSRVKGELNFKDGQNENFKIKTKPYFLHSSQFSTKSP